MAEKILVSGATGFIGKALIKSLVTEDYEIYALTSSPKNVPLDLINKKNVKFGFVDFEKPTDLRKLPFKIDYLIHLSGIFYERERVSRYFLVNTLSTLHLLEYAKRAKAQRFVLASTGGVYGYHEDKINEDCPPSPFDFLTISKYQAEMLVPQYEKYFSTATLRLFFPYGPGQKSGLMATLVRKIDIYDEVKVFNKDNPKINPVYIDDLIEILKRAIKTGGKQVLNVAGEEVVSFLEIIQQIGALLKKEPKIAFEANPAIKNLIGDTARMKEVLGFIPQVNLETGLKKTLGL
jgi:nucleoside-diphosphate-sugar epimerase